MTSDEFFHFIAGRCTYAHEGGEAIEIEPDTGAFLPKDWKGTAPCPRHGAQGLNDTLSGAAPRPSICRAPQFGRAGVRRKPS